MSEYMIVTDSSGDLSQSMVEELGSASSPCPSSSGAPP